MSIQSKPYYWVVCDCCGEKADYGDYSAMSDEQSAREWLEDADFRVVNGEDLCFNCWEWDFDADDTSDDEDEIIRSHKVHP